MTRRDLHMHTTFCDGKSTPEEMVIAAIDRGLSVIGFSAHSHTDFDLSYCLTAEGTAQYRSEVDRLRLKYRDRIRILCGIEQDIWSDAPTNDYDYVIGSVHYLKKDGVYIPVDESPEILLTAVEDHYGGDIYALAEDYYSDVSQVVERTGADIIGHFDLITKFNEEGRMFNEADPRYVAAWTAAADKLLKTGTPFEINTGAISRGWRTEPYPSWDILRYIAAKGGSVILSSDSHSADSLACRFDDCEALVRELGLSVSSFAL